MSEEAPEGSLVRLACWAWSCSRCSRPCSCDCGRSRCSASRTTRWPPSRTGSRPSRCGAPRDAEPPDRNGKVLVDRSRRWSSPSTPRSSTRSSPSQPQRSRYIGRLASDLRSFGVEVTVPRSTSDSTTPSTARSARGPSPRTFPRTWRSSWGSTPANIRPRRSNVAPCVPIPTGKLAAHILRATSAQLNEEEYDRESRVRHREAVPGRPTRSAKTGVERVFESWLRGTPGERVVQVDSANRVRRRGRERGRRRPAGQRRAVDDRHRPPSRGRGGARGRSCSNARRSPTTTAWLFPSREPWSWRTRATAISAVASYPHLRPDRVPRRDLRGSRSSTP